MQANDLIGFELDAGERRLLRSGLFEWSGPACCTEELAIALGFRSVAELFAESNRLAAAIEAGKRLTRLDWCRVLLATEIVFASYVVGSGSDWEVTTGMSDAESLATLRGLQRKLISEVRGLIGNGLGTLPRH